MRRSRMRGNGFDMNIAVITGASIIQGQGRFFFQTSTKCFDSLVLPLHNLQSSDWRTIANAFSVATSPYTSLRFHHLV